MTCRIFRLSCRGAARRRGARRGGDRRSATFRTELHDAICVAARAAFAEALLDPARALPEGITTARGNADPARFAVYRNNVFVGLTAALAKRFPVVRRLVGDEFFAGMARVYAGVREASVAADVRIWRRLP